MRTPFILASIGGLLLFPQYVPAAFATEQVLIDVGSPGPKINKDIFGQFVEHIGEGVYGGLWVGENSDIPNTRGLRDDVTEALKQLHIPVIRWPGGCFADQYHWREGIGPQSSRVSRNNAWGNVIEPNQFGSDEFMELAKQIGSEAYLTVNVGSGTVDEAADWFEYLTSDNPTTLATLRAENGHPVPYKVKYIGFGNEAWGCGGAMSADEYFARLKPFSVFALNHNPQQRFSGIDLLFNHGASNPEAMIKIAAGPNDNDTDFTESLMKSWSEAPGYLPVFDAMSLHHYTMSRGPMSDYSADFGQAEYAHFVSMAMGMEDVLTAHENIMDQYDPQKKVALVVDEWGNWLKPDISENPMFLKQQNSLRDAITAALTLNTFMRHADRVKMANIAQMVNVIQSMILTQGKDMLLTPTYHLYKMYVPFQDATFIPSDFKADMITIGKTHLPQIDVVSAKSPEGKIWMALINIDPGKTTEIEALAGGTSFQTATGSVLTAPEVNTVNEFGRPEAVKASPVRFEREKSGKLVISLPPKSVTVVSLQQ
ncbi:alpha-N-arabinofuranosidase [Alteromonas sp. NFXS44]|uniref:alpha-N-arabinofuranosidase n=1 Tax=Alteromonas sp. NFXS44 TaxID=2818435 RepID=UPI0032DF0F72